jgi:hypothetical protein
MLCLKRRYLRDIRDQLNRFSTQDVAIEMRYVTQVEYATPVNMFMALNMALRNVYERWPAF